jgi:hypothetical protein
MNLLNSNGHNSWLSPKSIKCNFYKLTFDPLWQSFIRKYWSKQFHKIGSRRVWPSSTTSTSSARSWTVSGSSTSLRRPTPCSFPRYQIPLLGSGANPTIVTYNTSAVKFHNMLAPWGDVDH